MRATCVRRLGLHGTVQQVLSLGWVGTVLVAPKIQPRRRGLGGHERGGRPATLRLARTHTHIQKRDGAVSNATVSFLFHRLRVEGIYITHEDKNIYVKIDHCLSSPSRFTIAAAALSHHCQNVRVGRCLYGGSHREKPYRRKFTSPVLNVNPLCVIPK